MRFIHLSDLHFGRTLAEFSLEEDQRYLIGFLVELARERSVDGVLIAGDVYDRANPGDGAMRLLGDFLEELADADIPVFLISGNHDSDEKLNFGRSFFARRNVFVYSVFDGTLHCETLTRGGQQVHIYMLPFVKASQVRQFYPDAGIDTYEDAVRTVLEHADVDPEECSILLAHQFVAGRGEQDSPHLGGSESASVRNVGNVERIGYGLFDAFDYVALGHIHSPQRVGREEVRYAGSPLKYSLSEAKDQKSVPIVELDGKGKVNIELVPVRPLRDLRHVRGSREQLLNPANITDTDDFLYVTLTEEEVVDDAMGIFQQFYPNTVKVDYDNAHTRALADTEIEAAGEEKGFSELIGDFYRQIYGCELSEEELKIMEETAKEAGIEDETR